MGRFAKAIAAVVVGAAFALLSLVPAVAAVVPPEVMAGLQASLVAAVVALIPNTIGGVNVAHLADSMVEAWLEEDDDEDDPSLGEDGLPLAGGLSLSPEFAGYQNNGR